MSFWKGQEAQSSLSFESLQPCRRFTFSEIQIATQNFDESLVIGCGGFGKVYKGTITNGNGHGERLLDAAIKRWEAFADQGQGALEFGAEIKMLSKLRHCHLVTLIGYCNDGQEMILVYEYMPHGTLAHHLHNCGTRLSWVRRIKICNGAAQGLHYLHTGTGIKHGVIHRDVKSSNILLDDSLEAMISDFGLSKLGPTNQACTHVETKVKGTFGYLDPDYFFTGRLTRKTDVYAFGVVLLEVLCGKKAVERSLDEEEWTNLAKWAQDSIKKDKLMQIVDYSLWGRTSHKCLKEFARLAEWCLHCDPKERPTMAEVVVGLESVLALHEKTYNVLQPHACITMFGRKVPMLAFSSNSVGGSRSLKSMDINLYKVGGEDRVLSRFDFDTINVATENFSEASRILRLDNYGEMYKGRLQNGQYIAISLRTCDYYADVMNEASTLVKLEHKNVVQLHGYCIGGTESDVYLLYDFVPYANLDHLLNDLSCAPMEWDKLYKILLGVAQALVYLHKHGVIHCDVQPKTILLDESLNPKLSSFWFSRCSAINEPDCISIGGIFGTGGYSAPEMNDSLYYRWSSKVDVFSFGVLVLKTVCGRKDAFHVHQPDIGKWVNHRLEHMAHHRPEEDVWRKWLGKTWLNMIDSRINVADSSRSIKRIVHIGMLCIQRKAADRPTMEEVVAMLLDTSSAIALSIPEVCIFNFWGHASVLLPSTEACFLGQDIRGGVY